MEREDWHKEAKELFLDTYFRNHRLAKELTHSAGTILKKGSRTYWQFYEMGRQIQRPLPEDQIEEVKKRIRILKHQEKKAKELKAFLKELKKALKAMGIDWQSVLTDYDQKQNERKTQALSRQAAKKIAANKWHGENYKHMTDKGDLVASKSEEIIANILFAYGIEYEYEKPMEIDGKKVVPDFTIYLKDGSVIIWEHAGLLEQEEYAQRLEEKMQLYEKAGYMRHKNLIVTKDENGALSAEAVRRMIDLYDLAS